mgnify:CR=1 FL=1
MILEFFLFSHSLSKYLLNLAFEKCYGLKDSLKKAVKTDDKLLLEGGLHTLSQYSGLRLVWIKSNLKTILND